MKFISAIYFEGKYENDRTCVARTGKMANNVVEVIHDSIRDETFSFFYYIFFFDFKEKNIK